MAVSVLKFDARRAGLFRKAVSPAARAPELRVQQTPERQAETETAKHLKRLLAADIHDQVTPPLTALLSALTISPTLLFCEPVH